MMFALPKIVYIQYQSLYMFWFRVLSTNNTVFVPYGIHSTNKQSKLTCKRLSHGFNELKLTHRQSLVYFWISIYNRNGNCYTFRPNSVSSHLRESKNPHFDERLMLSLSLFEEQYYSRFTGSIEKYTPFL